MLKIEVSMDQYIENNIKLKPNATPNKNKGEMSFWLCEKIAN